MDKFFLVFPGETLEVAQGLRYSDGFNSVAQALDRIDLFTGVELEAGDIAQVVRGDGRVMAKAKVNPPFSLVD